MNRKLALNLIFLVILFSNTACNKWLTLQPQDGITRQEFWQTKEQIQSAVVGCYSSLLQDPAGKDKPLSEYLFMWGELRGDMLAPGTGISSNENDIMNYNTLATNAMVKWNAVYRTINYCNTVIDYAPGVLALDNTLTKTQLNAYLSEAYSLRALMYFYLVRSFRDVPLKIKSTSNDDDLLLLAKAKSDTILKQIVSDLNFADSNAVFSYGNNTYNKGRITKYTVKAIKADVYLWMEDYTDCVSACDYIINSNQFGLISRNNSWFNTLYYNGNSNESIFEFQYDAQALNSFYNIFISSSSQRYLAAAGVMDDKFGIDLTNSDNYDIRGDGASVRTSDNTVWKYLGIDGSHTSRALAASYAHWFVYRYADILLMKAEALNQIGGRGADALALVYQIRTRAHAISVTDLNPDPSDQNGVADFILAERAREFAFEGKRWYDVLRNAKRNHYARMDILTTMLTLSVVPALQQSALGKSKDSNSHYFPIYTYELQNDPNLVQNPYYK